MSEDRTKCKHGRPMWEACNLCSIAEIDALRTRLAEAERERDEWRRMAEDAQARSERDVSLVDIATRIMPDAMALAAERAARERAEAALRKGRWLVEHGCSEWREGEPEDFEWNEVAGAFLADPVNAPQPTPTKEPVR